MLGLKEFIDSDRTNLSESIVGKGYAIAQNRQHASNRSKLLSVASRLKSLAEKGRNEDDQIKQQQILFALFQELANALKVQAEMARNEINVSTAGVLDVVSSKNKS